MLDNQVIIAMGAVINPRLAARNISAELAQGNQPTQQGVPTGALISLYKIMDVRYGYPKRATEWDETDAVMYNVVSELIESTFQFTCVVPQDPSNDFELTPADVLKATASILQSDSAIAALRDEGLSVLRVRDLRTGYAANDHGNFMANPTFDIVMVHADTSREIIGIVNAQEVVINRV